MFKSMHLLLSYISMDILRDGDFIAAYECKEIAKQGRKFRKNM